MRMRAFIPMLLILSCLGAQAAPRERSVATRFSYPQGKTEVSESFRGNPEALRLLDEVLRADAPVVRIEVKGVSSPEGALGANRRLAGERASLAVEFLKARYPSLPDSVFVVKTLAEDWAGVENYLTRSEKGWKEEALQIVKGASAKRKPLLQDLWVGEAWDELMKNSFPYLRRTEIQVVLEGDAAPGKRILFRSGYRSFVKSDPGNAEILQEVAEKLSGGYTGPIILTGYASPDGSAAANEKLSLARARSVQDYLAGELKIPQERIRVENGGIDWEGFAATVENSYYGADKGRVLEILADQNSTDREKKRALLALDGGKTWQKLKKEQMPLLCAVDVSFEGSAEQAEVELQPEPAPEIEPGPVPEPVVEQKPEPESEPVVEQQPKPEVMLEVKEEEPAVEPVTEPVQEAPIEATLEVKEETLAPVASAGNTLLGIGTNLAFDAITAANVTLDVPLGKHWDVTGDFIFPWWKNRSKDFAFQLLHMDLGGRYYFKPWERLDENVFHGWFVSASAGLGYYDFAPWGDGVQGEEMKFSLGGGYTWKLGNWWRLSAELGVGGLFSRFRTYEAQAPGVLMVKNQGDLIYWGPTQAQISLTYLLQRRTGGR